VIPPVLCYHRVGGPLELGVTRVSRSVFARQMQSLAAAGWRSLTLKEYGDLVLNPQSALGNPKSFLLTFDDAYADLTDTAYPVLKAMGFTATTFVITGYVGAENRWDVQYTRRRLRHLDWRAIEDWRGRGLEFASHTESHARLTWLDDARASAELRESRAELVRRLGPEAGKAVAYPFGAVDERVERLAREAGYSLGFGGVKGRGSNPLHLPRVPVYMWDIGNTPLGLRQGALGSLGRLVAHVANRASVGTSVMLRLFGSRKPRGIAPG
jgi:peptidoglycan/xylan/chitin deacetylase (PgdA/CDA1 family)